MEITRDVILDLLPMYIAGEVSDDTRVLIEKFLKTDPQLANLVQRSAALDLAQDIPMPLTQDDKLKAYRKARKLILLQSVALAIIIVLILTAVLWVFLVSA